ncbi:hypothetical protein OOK41_09250 [Micromonospora sp. NBC_01655]|uniref:hypothetical protein n=1 Tax=Micromonospora sp. NBC_01655 TaxID=2975983 RepID=UPI00225AB094|nr:hypothetical protein [Micromonospora sp. NBC_01655]MCX4470492.1 hypothetical protein [Micromonospora sp. NBC_01655]
MTTTDTPTTALDLDAIRLLANRATGGPWTLIERQDTDRRILVVVAEGHGYEHDDALVAEVPMEAGDDINDWRNDAEFIAGARTLVPALCAEVDRLRAELAEIADAVAPTVTIKPPAAAVRFLHQLYTSWVKTAHERLTQIDKLTTENEQLRAALAAEQTRTSRLEDALAATEQQAASMRIALDRADAEAEGR